VEYLQANKGDAEYLLAASSAMSTSPIILNTDEPVISLGGYNGIDPVFTAGDLAELVDEGAVRFFLMPDREAIEEMRAEREAADSRSAGSGSGTPGGVEPLRSDGPPDRAAPTPEASAQPAPQPVQEEPAQTPSWSASSPQEAPATSRGS